ncbi:MAG TPA: hypothetical protein VLW85_19135 [Myxococcales bacterium]|nr:hypothetical protein [Myxococcales bacterium]
MAGEVTYYRFKVRGPDGVESAEQASRWPAVTTAGGGLYDARWSDDSFKHGDTATMTVDAPGLDGRQVKFTVEHRHAGEWSKQSELTATVADGKASAQIEVQHPAPGEDEAADLRFHCELL